MPPLNQVDIALHGGLVTAFLDRADLRDRNLSGANFSGASLRGADLSRANLKGANFTRADLARACLYQADCEGADFTSADLTGAYLRATNFSNCKMWATILKRVSAKSALFFDADMQYSDLADGEFLGARFDGVKTYGMRNVDRAIFHWWVAPGGSSKPSYKPIPGYQRWNRSATGGLSFGENAGPRGRY